MKASKVIFLTLLAVVFVFVKQSHGKKPMTIADSVKLLKIMTHPKFQEVQEMVIMAGTDEDSLAARGAIEAIRKEVQKYPVRDVLPLAVNTTIGAIIGAVRLKFAAVRQANKAIDSALKLIMVQNTQGATDVINDLIKADRELVFIGGVPIHSAEGFALGLAGGLALPGLRNSIISIENAGHAAFEILEITGKIATDGIIIGGPAGEKALNSARGIISIGSKAIYEYLKEAAVHALEGLQYAVSNKIENADVLPGIVENLQTQIDTNSSAALVAIDKLSSELVLTLSVSTKKPESDAALVMYEGLRSTIVESANAISVGKRALREAGQLVRQDLKSAVGAISKGIKDAQKKLISGSAFAYLALGAAGQITNKKIVEELVPAVVKTEYGIVTAFDYLELAAKTAIVSMGVGKSATPQGIQTALEMCDTAETALTQNLAVAGNIGLEVIRQMA